MVKKWVKLLIEEARRDFWLNRENRFVRLIQLIVMLGFYIFFMFIFAYALVMLLEPIRYVDIISNFGSVSYARYTLVCIVLIFGICIFIFPYAIIQVVTKRNWNKAQKSN
jgi:uncharacterized BrkB/YihY/UPF0761 family membrane protein